MRDIWKDRVREAGKIGESHVVEVTVPGLAFCFRWLCLPLAACWWRDVEKKIEKKN